ncbi:sigma-70 family RNA polymerase sigma factor [Kribbella sp. HUAS MG21]|jgi:RNA polymerase sigma-70 factor (ECF subfamily)|uniref:Sigma-70 family RNA polymerase sigma factor n=1 Tax=Kribbella sp. HUAS MG21 TaxID=3160966 RepID=A0AAU7TA86_9ACTN
MIKTPVDANTPWDDLVRDHFAQVYRIACGLTRNRHDACDLTQDVFVQVFRNLATYTPQNFDGWLYRITVNLFRSQTRRNRQLRLHQLGQDVVDERPSGQPGPDELLTDRIVDNDIRAALADLPTQYRVAVLLRDIDGLSNQEIATVLDIKRGTVGSRLHRGHARLRAALAHRAPTASHGGHHA